MADCLCATGQTNDSASRLDQAPLANLRTVNAAGTQGTMLKVTMHCCPVKCAFVGISA